MNQTIKIINLLEKRGDKGVLNTELNRIAFRYGARLKEIRDVISEENKTIKTEYVKKGVFRYTLI